MTHKGRWHSAQRELLAGICSLPVLRLGHGKDRIVCEGIVDGANLSSFYQRRESYKQQMEHFCTGDYWDCPICAALDEKYRED